MLVIKNHLLIAGSVLLMFSSGCKRQQSSVSNSDFVVVGVDRQTSGDSAFPTAIDPSRVGKYPAETKSGAGYFYDDVLEYRVWFHPEKGATPLNGRKDYFFAFAQYEQAKAFADSRSGSEPPLVVVRQFEWIDEPKEGQYIPQKGERITEWQVVWLKNDKRNDKSIEEFLKNPRPAQKDDLGDTQE
jgi:putative acetyltransferase